MPPGVKVQDLSSVPVELMRKTVRMDGFLIEDSMTVLVRAKRHETLL